MSVSYVASYCFAKSATNQVVICFFLHLLLYSIFELVKITPTNYFQGRRTSIKNQYYNHPEFVSDLYSISFVFVCGVYAFYISI